MPKEGTTISFHSQLAPPVWKHPSFLVMCFETAAELQRHAEGITIAFEPNRSLRNGVMAEFAWRNRSFAKVFLASGPDREEVTIPGLGTPSYETRTLPMTTVQEVTKWLKHLLEYRLREVRSELEREAGRIEGVLSSLEAQ